MKGAHSLADDHTNRSGTGLFIRFGGHEMCIRDRSGYAAGTVLADGGPFPVRSAGGLRRIGPPLCDLLVHRRSFCQKH